eukprot:sb/3472061/
MSVSSVDSMELMDSAPPLMEMHINSADRLMLTLTKSALKNIQVLSEAWSSVNDVMKIEPKATTPLMIQNLCGVNVTVKGKLHGSRTGPAPQFTLLNNETQSMKLDQARGDRRGAKLSRDHSSANMKITDAASISVIIEGFEEIKDIKIVQAGVYLYSLVPSVKSSNKREVGIQ